MDTSRSRLGRPHSYFRGSHDTRKYPGPFKSLLYGRHLLIRNPRAPGSSSMISAIFSATTLGSVTP